MLARWQSRSALGGAKLTTRWIFTEQGKPAYYQATARIYNTEGKYSFWVDEGWWLRVPDGHPSYYISDDWVFTPDGKPVFYYKDGAATN